MPDALVDELRAVLAREPLDLARAALTVARLEYPRLDIDPYLEQLERLGARAAVKISAAGPTHAARVSALTELLYDEEGFAGNRAQYDDYRNSFLNAVLERRVGLPITLALVYMEVGRRAGLTVRGIGFPGHFLMRAPVDRDALGDADLILDPFDRARIMSDSACRSLLGTHTDRTRFSRALLDPCSPRHMLARLLNNLKRTYVELRSFPQARRVTDLLLVVDPTLLSELRDRGLLAYHLDDFPSALRDLEDYLKLNAWSAGATPDEEAQLWEHVRSLRRRVAGMN